MSFHFLSTSWNPPFVLNNQTVCVCVCLCDVEDSPLCSSKCLPSSVICLRRQQAEVVTQTDCPLHSVLFIYLIRFLSSQEVSEWKQRGQKAEAGKLRREEIGLFVKGSRWENILGSGLWYVSSPLRVFVSTDKWQNATWYLGQVLGTSDFLMQAYVCVPLCRGIEM